ncbi:transposase [Micromonospora sp. URMC 106]|uniref:transposase n=1 Tax=Micromonospora sp. URMC 106 TaxID=3423408 RepID=UPI003F1BCAD6
MAQVIIGVDRISVPSSSNHQRRRRSCRAGSAPTATATRLCSPPAASTRTACGRSRAATAQQARALLATVRPRDVVGKTRRRLASELIDELVVIGKKIKVAKQELTDLVDSTGSRLIDLTGIGPSGAAHLLVDIARFTSRAHFASWHGTAPIGASSGDQNRHRRL